MELVQSQDFQKGVLSQLGRPDRHCGMGAPSMTPKGFLGTLLYCYSRNPTEAQAQWSFVLVSHCCFNKLPQTSWLELT